LVLIEGAAPDRPFQQSPFQMTIATLPAIACLITLIAWLRNWDWRARYFGTYSLYVGSVALVGIVPCLCIVLYATLPLVIRSALLVGYLVIHILWCLRFVVYYRRIVSDDSLRSYLYHEEHDAVYYLQRGDKFLFEKRNKLLQAPQDRYFALAGALAILMVFGMNEVRQTTGLPFVFSFLTVVGFPVSLMCSGLAVRGWLIFYLYPAQIRRTTGKQVYVDLTGKPTGG
jgi:hypothetical protein